MNRIKKLENLEPNRLQEIIDIVDKALTNEEKIHLDKSQEPAYLLKLVYENKYAVINGRKYKISTFTHKKRLKVFAYFTSVNVLIESHNYSFMDSDKFDEIETLIFENTTFENCKLTAKHFEKYEFDHVKYIVNMLGGISYPCFADCPTN
jgi:hypothetical protein